MKTYLVMISLIMISFSLSAQEQYGRWLPVSGNTCDNHLEYRIRFLEKSYSKNYELKIQWKNTNSEKIHFNSYIYLDGKKRDGGRTSVDAMGTSNENWFITTSKTPPTVRIEKVALGADDIYANRVECNHLTGRYQRRNSKTKKESQKEIKDKNPIDEFFKKREKEQEEIRRKIENGLNGNNTFWDGGERKPSSMEKPKSSNSFWDGGNDNTSNKKRDSDFWDGQGTKEQEVNLEKEIAKASSNQYLGEVETY